MAHPDSAPDPDHLIVGDIRDTLPDARRIAPHGVALVHSDIGTGEAARNARLAGWLAGVLLPLMAPGGVVASDQPLEHPASSRCPYPRTCLRGAIFSIGELLLWQDRREPPVDVEARARGGRVRRAMAERDGILVRFWGCAARCPARARGRSATAATPPASRCLPTTIG